MKVTWKKVKSAIWELIWFNTIDRSTKDYVAFQRLYAVQPFMCQEMVVVGGNWVIIEKNVKRWSDKCGTTFGVGSDFNLTHFIAGDCVSECAPLPRASGNCHCLPAALPVGCDVNEYNKVEQSATKALAPGWSICLFICCHFRFRIFPLYPTASSLSVLSFACPILQSRAV